ncbi:hypothetical protein Taro_029737 [Colocasia esculenta]|uniref:Uncharacterized protein n=1 Tax=Colocasia esculenta TaxID=4460 RepID=A0A843VVT6_COLES|nr:hypothetical protein [Colocasia esculenta]
MPRWDSHRVLWGIDTGGGPIGAAPGLPHPMGPPPGCALSGDPTRGRAHPVGPPPVLRTRWESHRGRAHPVGPPPVLRALCEPHRGCVPGGSPTGALVGPASPVGLPPVLWKACIKKILLSNCLQELMELHQETEEEVPDTEQAENWFSLTSAQRICGMSP